MDNPHSVAIQQSGSLLKAHHVKTLRELSYFRGRRAVCLWGGDQNFLGWSKRENSLFSVGQRGQPKFFEGQRGWTKDFCKKKFLRLRRNSFRPLQLLSMVRITGQSQNLTGRQAKKKG